MIGNSFYYLIVQTDGMTKCVLGVLLMLSIVCWAVFLGKVILFRIKKRDLAQVRTMVQQVKHKDQIRDLVIRAPHSMASYFVGSLLAFHKQSEMGALSTSERNEEVAQLIDQILVQEESYGTILITSAAVSPLLGLLGTVWGLIHSFMGISQSRVADIATIAPGIAEALVTTLAGLLVAIPSLVMANIIAAQVRSLEAQLAALVTDVYKILTLNRTKKEGLCATVPGVADQHEL